MNQDRVLWSSFKPASHFENASSLVPYFRDVSAEDLLSEVLVDHGVHVVESTRPTDAVDVSATQLRLHNMVLTGATLVTMVGLYLFFWYD